MRTIERTTEFKRDYKRLGRGTQAERLIVELTAVLKDLAKDVPLSLRHRDHPLTGEWKDHRDCHVRPDLILIYRRPDVKTLQLVRLGSHSELGL